MQVVLYNGRRTVEVVVIDVITLSETSARETISSAS